MLCIKCRRTVIDAPISGRLKENFEGIGADCKVTLTEQEQNSDHIHKFTAEDPRQRYKSINIKEVGQALLNWQT